MKTANRKAVFLLKLVAKMIRSTYCELESVIRKHVESRIRFDQILTAILVLVTWISAPLNGNAQTSRISVSDALSYSFASGLVAASHGNQIAWIENHEGKRNIWIAQAPDWRGRAITSYTVDDGQDLSSLTFTPDGKSLLFIRGAAPNRDGEVHDALYTPKMEIQSIWKVTFDTREVSKIVDSGNFALSPDGRHLAMRKGKDIVLTAVEHSDSTKVFSDGALKVYGGEEVVAIARIRGSLSSIIWSPTGSHLAFVSNRGDHSFVGVVDRFGESLRYLDPSVERDNNPVWSPDGKQIAFIRIPNERVRAARLEWFVERREALPFSIRVADLDNGSSYQAWKAREGVGSAFSGVEAASQLFWTDDNRLVFPWEADGWKHLYSIPAKGGQATLLTPGAFEVQQVSISTDRKKLIYNSGQGDINRKHVWTVNPDGDAQPRYVTSGDGIEWNPVFTADGFVAFHASSATDPAHTIVLLDGERRRVSPPLPSSFPRSRMITPIAVEFDAPDGLRIYGQLFLPPEVTGNKPKPAVLFLHGGSRRQMLLGFHHRGYYHNAYAMHQIMANAGYVVLSVNFRSGIGYGLEFREALNYGAGGASEFQDVLAGAQYLKSRPEVDPKRIGLWGGSYGGYLTALGLARASNVFAAGVDIHGVHDWNVGIHGFLPSYDPKDHPEYASKAFESSPMAFLDGWKSPVLLIHGDDDRNVPFSETVDLAEELERRNVEYEVLVFPDEIHSFSLHRNWISAYEATLDFFHRKLLSIDK